MRKNFIFRLYLIIFFFASPLILIPTKVNAVNILNGACNNSNAASRPSVCSDNSNGTNPLFGPHGIITTVVQFLTILVGIAAVITIIIAGLRFVLAMGDSNTASTARNAILYAVIGLIIALVSQALITFVLNKVNV